MSGGGAAKAVAPITGRGAEAVRQEGRRDEAGSSPALDGSRRKLYRCKIKNQSRYLGRRSGGSRQGRPNEPVGPASAATNIPTPMTTHNGSTNSESNPSADPETRRRQLETRIRELGGVVGSVPGPEPHTEMINAFLERVLAAETAPHITHREWLKRRGRQFPAPETLHGPHVTVELWRLVQALATARVFIERTDHLDDAGLYARLWHEVLDADEPDIPRTEADAWHWNFSEAGSDDETEWLTYYASDDEREEWQEMFPELTLPEHRRLPYERDHLLPKRK
jgi:hypothetical protein